MAERSEQVGLHNLKPKPGTRKPRKRIGRGEGSGLGKQSGRGHKGAGARSGSKRKVAYEGGQNPIHMRMRKLRGPHRKMSMPFERFRTRTQPVNVGDLDSRFKSGAKDRAGFEGGQNPIHMRMRKLRGPTMKKSMPFEKFRTHTQPVNVADLEERFDKGAEVTPELLKENGLAKRKGVPVKILGRGEISKSLTVHAHGFSKSASAAIEAAGGTCQVIE